MFYNFNINKKRIFKVILITFLFFSATGILLAFVATDISWGDSMLNSGGSIDLKANNAQPFIDFANDLASDYDIRLSLSNDETLFLEGGSLNVEKRIRSNAVETKLQEMRFDGYNPYIDFSNDLTSDYDIRIQLANDDTIWVQGGNIQVDGKIIANSYSCTSDQRFKKNISPITDSLSKLMKLTGVSYFWRVDEYKDMNFPANRDLGFIAQDVEKILPELVYTDSKGYKSVEYAKMVAVVVEAMKEMKTANDEKVSALENENRILREKIAMLEKMNDRITLLEKAMSEKTIVTR